MKSLKASGHELADSARQLQSLRSEVADTLRLPQFRQKLEAVGLFPLRPVEPAVFQVNLGKMCNQVCRHCHVDAGPDRREIMTQETMQACLDALAKTAIPTVDLTGGAPEMNPHFRPFVEQIRALGRNVMVRCNLTIIVANPKYHDLPDFFRQHQVEVVSSLPFYNADKTDRQRGKGVFADSIKALRMLNAVGYGQPDSGLVINLVYNPAGAFLPASQEGLKRQFKRVLWDEFGIVFNDLYAITNIPISRYLDYLITSGNYDGYMEKLINAFNPAAAVGVMCRNTISVGWDGFLYDCDFNQMLDLKVAGPVQHVRDFDGETLSQRAIVVNEHCYGCTAGGRFQLRRNNRMKAYDLIVVGAGSGGLSIGLSMHELGFRVLFVEKEERAIGGECLNTGCIPSKALIHVTRQLYQAKLAQAFGVTLSGKPDFAKVKQYVNDCIEHIRSHENADYFRQQGIDVAIGPAHFTGPNTVDVSGQAFTARRIVIATGSQPVLLQVPGIEQVNWYDNRTIFSIPALPDRLLVVGGGPIAVELSQAFHRLGSQVTLVQSGDTILEKESAEVSNLLLDRLSGEGIDFRLQTKLLNFPSAHRATLEDKSGGQSQLDFDAVLVAIGRQIDVTELRPDAAGIQTDKGRLKLNAYLRTTNPSIYAIGDVTGQLYFSHTPEMQAPILINNFLSPFKQKVDYRHFSWVTFTDPEVATFGLTENQLQQQGIRYEKIVYDFTEDDRAVVDAYTYGKLWLYVSPGRGLLRKRNLLGGSVVAPQAGEMIQDLILTNTFDLGTGAIRQKIYPYPVASRVSKMALLDQLKRDIPAWAKAMLRRLY